MSHCNTDSTHFIIKFLVAISHSFLCPQFPIPLREKTSSLNYSCSIYILAWTMCHKQHVVRVQIIQFRSKDTGNHQPRTLIVNTNGLINVVLKEIWTPSTKSTPNTDFSISKFENFILHEPIHPKMRFITEEKLSMSTRIIYSPFGRSLLSLTKYLNLNHLYYRILH